jgi:hypothetical protein
MPQADRVHSTPPTNTSKSTAGAPGAVQFSPQSLIPASRSDACQATAASCEAGSIEVTPSSKEQHIDRP